MWLLPPLSPLLLSAPMKLDSLLWWIPNFGIYACATSELSCWRKDSWACSPAPSLHSGQEHGSCVPKRWAHFALYWVSQTRLTPGTIPSTFIQWVCACWSWNQQFVSFHLTTLISSSVLSLMPTVFWLALILKNCGLQLWYSHFQGLLCWSLQPSHLLNGNQKYSNPGMLSFLCAVHTTSSLMNVIVTWTFKRAHVPVPLSHVINPHVISDISG